MDKFFIDLFSGCGGLSLGLSNAGFRHLFAVEHHADAFATYKRNLLDTDHQNPAWPNWLPQTPHDVRDLLHNFKDNLASLRGSVDLIAGGPPCQGFTTNGRRDPEDPRSTMVDAYLETVSLVMPKMVLIENVRGFTSMPHPDGGYYPDHVRTRLETLGYECFSTILHAAEWGVPQRRPRFILIAAPRKFLRGIDPVQRLRVQRRGFLSRLSLWPGPTSVHDAISDLEITKTSLIADPECGAAGFQSIDYHEPFELSPYAKLMRGHCVSAPTDMRLAKHGPKTTERMADILNSCPRGRAIGAEDRERLGIRKRSTTPLDANAPSPTITTLPDDLIHYSEPRTMTVREHARIQSFPDWFSFSGRYTAGGLTRRTSCPRYTQVGNAVPPLLAQAIGEMLSSILDDQNSMDLSDRPKLAQESRSSGRKILNRKVNVAIAV